MRPSSIVPRGTTTTRSSSTATKDGPGPDRTSRGRWSAANVVVVAASARNQVEDSGSYKGDATHAGSVTMESSNRPRIRIDDLFFSAGVNGEKHDYDWLLTPPTTPASDARRIRAPAEQEDASTPGSLSRSNSPKLRYPQSDGSEPPSPASSSSTRCSTISSTHSTKAYASPNTIPVTTARPSTPNRLPAPATSSISRRRASSSPSSTPNRLPASARPATPTRNPILARPSTPPLKVPTAARSSTPIKRSTPVRSSTPTKPSTPSRRSNSASTTDSQTARAGTSRASTQVRPRPLSTSRDGSQPPQVSRQSPTSNSSSRSNANAASRSQRLTPPRKTLAPSSAPTALRSISAERVPASSARSASPSTQLRSKAIKGPVQPIIPPDFPLHVPPNLRTKLPERPASAGRTRPGTKLTVQAQVATEALPDTKPTRKQSPTQVNPRGLKARIPGNGYETSPTEMRGSARDGMTKKPSKVVATVSEDDGGGHVLTKRSLELALKRMDIRQGTGPGGIRGMSLFPHSIRAKSTPSQSSGFFTPTTINETDSDDNGTTPRSFDDVLSHNGEIATSHPHGALLAARVTSPDTNMSYGNTNYGVILMKGENKDMDWLHSDESNADLLKENDRDIEWLHGIEEDIDHIPMFERKFEMFPEPVDHA